jgi:pyocin large subunit-like protein
LGLRRCRLAGCPNVRSARCAHREDAYPARADPEKHGAEFGHITQDEYLALAQALRDKPAGGPVLEIVRGDGVRTRFDRETGHFGAYNPDRTIRTFFIPNDGERYFERQAHGAH